MEVEPDVEVEPEAGLVVDARAEEGADIASLVKSTPRLFVAAPDVRNFINPVDDGPHTTCAAGSVSSIE